MYRYIDTDIDISLPDHAQIPAGELERLRRFAAAEEAALVTIYIYVHT